MAQSLFGDYLLRDSCGSGSQASVMFAEHFRSGERCALKIYELEKTTQKRGFECEVSALAKLQNKAGIIAASKSFEFDGKGVIVMELMETDLLELILAKNFQKKLPSF